MDSHLIYTVSSHLRRTVNWSEWVYCGVEDDLNEVIISDAINDCFKDPLFYVTTRKETHKSNKKISYNESNKRYQNKI